MTWHCMWCDEAWRWRALQGYTYCMNGLGILAWRAGRVGERERERGGRERERRGGGSTPFKRAFSKSSVLNAYFYQGLRGGVN